MHHSLLILLMIPHLNQVPQDQTNDSTQQKSRSSEPRILPNPTKITLQANRLPAIQEAPPSNFVPPKSLDSSSSFGSQGNNGKPGNTFDPRGNFNPGGASKSLGDSGSKTGGFQAVNPATARPLRTSNPDSKPPQSFAPAGTEGNQSSILVRPASQESRQSSTPPSSTLPSSNPPSSNPPSSNSAKSNSMVRPAGNFTLDDRPRETQTNGSTQELPGTATTPPTQNGFSPGRPPNAAQNSDPSTGINLGNRPASTNRSSIQPSIQPASRPERLVPPKAEAKPEPRRASPVDDTYDPQLKAITDSILVSIKRPEKNRLSLASAISASQNQPHRKSVVKQYWTCFVTSADLQFAEQELNLLKSLPRPTTQLDQLLLRAATSSSQARLAEARIAHRKSTAALHKSAPIFDPTLPVSFADLPWVGQYSTNSEGFVESGLFSSQIRKVDEALPAIRDLIYLRGAALYDNLAALQHSASGLANGASKLELVLKLHQEARDQRIEFLRNIEKYNHAIADYAISVFPNTREPLVVAGMLVDTKKTLPADTIQDGNVRQASGTQPESR